MYSGMDITLMFTAGEGFKGSAGGCDDKVRIEKSQRDCLEKVTLEIHAAPWDFFRGKE